MTQANIIDGKALAAEKHAQLLEHISLLKACFHRTPKLVTIIVGNDLASNLYVDKKVSLCKQIGMAGEIIRLPDTLTTKTLCAQIQALNQAMDVTGILVQLPLPKSIDTQQVIDSLSPDKDVDGFHPINMGRLLIGKPRLRPCTPYGIIHMLESINFPLKGVDAVVVGTSNIVGRPMIAELLLAGATVTACHRLTRDLERQVKQADLLISATGVPGLIKGEWIKPGSVVIDVGITRLANGKLAGDVVFETAKARAAYITPVPGGVGPMTVATLMQNTIEAFLLQQDAEHLLKNS